MRVRFSLLFMISNIRKIALIESYKDALRQAFFIDYEYTSFIIWKLKVENIHILPKYKTWYWKSFYSNKSRIKLGFLLNLYFALDVWSYYINLKIFGYTNESTIGWGLIYKDNLNIHINLFDIVHEKLVDQIEISLYTVTSPWLNVKPNSWVTLLNQSTFLKENTDYTYENYILLDNFNHGFQFKIICKLPEKRFIKTLSSYYIKVLLLRGFRYPILFNYKYIRTLMYISLFGQRQKLPWEDTLQPKYVWIKNPITIKLVKIGRWLSFFLYNSNVTEYLIKKHIYEFVNHPNKNIINQILEAAFVKNWSYWRFLKRKHIKLL